MLSRDIKNSLTAGVTPLDEFGLIERIKADPAAASTEYFKACEDAHSALARFLSLAQRADQYRFKQKDKDRLWRILMTASRNVRTLVEIGRNTPGLSANTPDIDLLVQVKTALPSIRSTLRPQP